MLDEDIRQVSGAVDVSFPSDKERSLTNPTFMFTGVCVKADAVPSTAEDVQVLIVVQADTFIEEFVLVKRDLATDSIQDWTWTIDGGPIAIGVDKTVRVVYPNTDGNKISVLFLGHYR